MKLTVVILLVLLVASIAVNVVLLLRGGEGEHDDGLWTCGMHPQVIQDHPGNCPLCGMKLVPVRDVESHTDQGDERKVLYWRSPMDPTFVSDSPGKAPDGMDLVPVYEDEVMSGAVAVDPATMQSIGLRAEAVKRRAFSRTIRATGRVAIAEDRLVKVSPRVSGWIESLSVSRTGAYVKKGDVLFELYSPELVADQQEYLLALRSRERLAAAGLSPERSGTGDVIETARQRLLQWDMDPAQISEVESTGEAKRTVAFRAPRSGVVLETMAVLGARVMEGMELYTIADLSSVWVIADVFESDLPWIRTGASAHVVLPYSSDTLSGRVSFVYPTVDAMSRTAKVRIEVANPRGALKPDMYADVLVKAGQETTAIAIPRQAVIRSGSRDVVFVDAGGGRFAPREVALGREGDDGLIEVKSGLLEGESVVVSGQFLLDSEANLQEAISRLAARDSSGATTAAPPTHQHGGR